MAKAKPQESGKVEMRAKCSMVGDGYEVRPGAKFTCSAETAKRMIERGTAEPFDPAADAPVDLEASQQLSKVRRAEAEKKRIEADKKAREEEDSKDEEKTA